MAKIKPEHRDTCPDCEFESAVHASHEHDWEGRALRAESALAASQQELAQAKKEAEDNLTLPLTADYMRTKGALAASQAEVAKLKERRVSNHEHILEECGVSDCYCHAVFAARKHDRREG